MESEGDEIKSKQASKKDRTLRDHVQWTLNKGLNQRNLKCLGLSCCKKHQKSPNQETDFGKNRVCLQVLNDSKLILND